MRKLILNSLALACAMATGTGAQANDVTFTGFSHGSESVNYSVLATATHDARSGAASAGGFATIGNGGASFESYCVDLYQFISFGTLYTEYGAPTTAHAFANNRASADLGRLFANNFGAVNNSVTEAAFQIAVWEIAFEKSTNPYSLTLGDATFTGGSADSTGALTLASSWLSGLGNGNGSGIRVLESGEHQDVVYAPVPEPETYALLMAGLGAVSFMARRRKR